MARKICRKPFEWMELFHTPDFSMYLCCPGWLPMSVGSIQQQSLDALWTNETAREIRSSVIDGTFKHCNEYCPYLGDETMPESPVEWVDDEEYHELQLAVQYPDLYQAAPKTINLAYDRSCNLRCPSCRDEIILNQDDENTEYDAAFDNVISSYGSEKVTLYVTGGGDPFASTHYRAVLESEALKQAENIRLRLHTNAILLTEKRWLNIEHLHNRIDFIEISMDGATKASYETNRFPAKWDTFLKRMDFIKQIKLANPQIQLKINFVLQTNNFRDIPRLISYRDKWHIDVLKISLLDNWGTFTEEQYQSKSIHRQSHPKHAELIAILSDPVISDSENIILDSELKLLTRRIPVAEI